MVVDHFRDLELKKCHGETWGPLIKDLFMKFVEVETYLFFWWPVRVQDISFLDVDGGPKWN